MPRPTKRKKDLGPHIGLTSTSLTREQLHVFSLMHLDRSIKDTIKVPEFHWDMYRHFEQNARYIFVAAPVGFAKSTVLKQFGLRQFITAQEPLILYVSSNTKKVRDQMTSLTSLLESKSLQLVFNYRIARQNNAENFVDIEFLDKDGAPEHSARFQATSASSDISGINYEGKRPSLILIDDIEELDQARSKARTDELQDWLLTTLFSRLPSLTEGKVCMIGTTLTKDCIASRIINNTPDDDGHYPFLHWKVKLYQALDADNKSIWEDRFPTDALLREKESSPKSFARNYMNQPLDVDAGFIKKSMFKYFDPTNLESFNPKEIKYITQHWDLASGKSKRADFFAGMTVGLGEDGYIYVLDMFMDKLDPGAQVSVIINYYNKYKDKYKLHKITFDNNSYQSTLKFWVDKRAREENLYLPIHGVEWRAGKEDHLETHTPLFTSESVVLPKKHHLLSTFENQLCNFGATAHDDLVDCFLSCADTLRVKKNVPRFGIKIF